MKRKQYLTPSWMKASKSEDGLQGVVQSAFAQLDVVDSDRDLTPSGIGVIDGNPPVKVCQWGHQWHALPAGRGVIKEQDGWLVAELTYFLDTPQGAAEYATQKALADNGDYSEWSYGYDVLESGDEVVDGMRVQVLKKLHIFEVSPVLRGAGVDTRTLAVKSETDTCSECGQPMPAKSTDAVDDSECPSCDKPLSECTCGTGEGGKSLDETTTDTTNDTDADAKRHAANAIASYEVSTYEAEFGIDTEDAA